MNRYRLGRIQPDIAEGTFAIFTKIDLGYAQESLSRTVTFLLKFELGTSRLSSRNATMFTIITAYRPVHIH
jgi:hypothetical protein